MAFHSSNEHLERTRTSTERTLWLTDSPNTLFCWPNKEKVSALMPNHPWQTCSFQVFRYQVGYKYLFFEIFKYQSSLRCAYLKPYPILGLFGCECMAYERTNFAFQDFSLSPYNFRLNFSLLFLYSLLLSSSQPYHLKLINQQLNVVMSSSFNLPSSLESTSD